MPRPCTLTHLPRAEDSATQGAPRCHPPKQRDWYVIAEQPAPAPHLAHPEGCAALRIVLVTVPRVSRSCEHFVGVGTASRSRSGAKRSAPEKRTAEWRAHREWYTGRGAGVGVYLCGAAVDLAFGLVPAALDHPYRMSHRCPLPAHAWHVRGGLWYVRGESVPPADHLPSRL